MRYGVLLCVGIIIAVSAPTWAQDPPTETGDDAPAVEQPAPEPAEVSIADFEDEGQVAAFVTRDSSRESDPDDGRALVYVFPSALPPGGHSLHMMFNDGEDAWAGAYTDIDGAAWAAAGAERFFFVANSYRGAVTIDVALETADGTRYVAEVEVEGEAWSPISVPLSSFIDDEGEPIGDALADLTSLGFEKRGTWRGCVLRVDDLMVLPGTDDPGTDDPGTDDPGTDDPGTDDPGTDDPGTDDPGTDDPGTIEIPDDAYTVSLTTAFQSRETPIYFRTYLGMNVTPDDVELLEEPGVRQMVKAIDPIIRMVVDAPVSPAGDEAVYEKLDPLVDAVRKVAKERGAMVCVDAPIDGGVSDKRFADFCAALVKRYNFADGTRRSADPIRYWEILEDPIFVTDSDYGQAAQMYNLAAKAMKAVDPEIRTGGMSLFASEKAPMDRVLRGTKGLLSYLSWHFYGAAVVSVTDEELLRAADSGLTYGVEDAIAPTGVLDLLRVGDLYDSGLLFVSECNLNKARTIDGRCQDPRASQAFAAAWLASYFVSAGTVVDVTLLSRMAGPSWGMIHPDGTAGPVYWTARLFQDHMPRGTEVLGVRSTERDGDIRALAGLLDEKRMVLIVNRSDQPAQVEVSASGLGRNYSATLYRIADDGKGIVETALEPETARAGAPASERGALRLTDVILPAYGVGIVEFTPRRPAP